MLVFFLPLPAPPFASDNAKSKGGTLKEASSTFLPYEERITEIPGVHANTFQCYHTSEK